MKTRPRSGGGTLTVTVAGARPSTRIGIFVTRPPSARVISPSGCGFTPTGPASIEVRRQSAEPWPAIALSQGATFLTAEAPQALAASGAVDARTRAANAFTPSP